MGKWLRGADTEPDAYPIRLFKSTSVTFRALPVVGFRGISIVVMYTIPFSSTMRPLNTMLPFWDSWTVMPPGAALNSFSRLTRPSATRFSTVGSTVTLGSGASAISGVAGAPPPRLTRPPSALGALGLFGVPLGREIVFTVSFYLDGFGTTLLYRNGERLSNGHLPICTYVH